MRLLICGLALASAGVVSVRAQPPAAWVTITGRVVHPAGVPVPVRLPLPANAQGCPKGPILDEAVVIDPKTRGVKNVVVWLRPNNPNPKAAFAANEIDPANAKRKPQDLVIDQPCCMFEPHVIAARVGDTVVVKNTAPIAHNFFWISANNGELNQTIPANGQFRFPAPLVAESVPISFKCTIHPWMSGYLRIFDHPYYAVTDDTGAFVIKNAPAGNYRIVYWHEKIGFLGGRNGRLGDPVAIAAGPNGAMVLKPTDFDVTK
jgi:plastocyanin